MTSSHAGNGLSQWPELLLFCYFYSKETQNKALCLHISLVNHGNRCSCSNVEILTHYTAKKQSWYQKAPAWCKADSFRSIHRHLGLIFMLLEPHLPASSNVNVDRQLQILIGRTIDILQSGQCWLFIKYWISASQCHPLPIWGCRGFTAT